MTNRLAYSSSLYLRRRYQDSAVPAANGVVSTSLVRLFPLTEDVDYSVCHLTEVQFFV